MDSPASWLALLDKGGTVTLCIFLFVAFVKGWIVPRWTYDQLLAQYNKLDEQVAKLIDLGVRAASAAEKKVP